MEARRWLGGLEPAGTLITFESFQALREEPPASQTAIRISANLPDDEIVKSAVTRNTLILLKGAIERGGLALIAAGNLPQTVVANLREVIE